MIGGGTNTSMLFWKKSGSLGEGKGLLPRHLPLLIGVRGETVWKIAQGLSSVGFCRQEAADRLPFVLSWKPSGTPCGTRSDFPNSFGEAV
jgi:hypothetical protein